MGKYLPPDKKEGQGVRLDYGSFQHPPISKEFKLVFVTAAGGTLLFILLCVGLTLAAGRQPPDLMTELIHGLFSLTQVGFGAVVGLLGGKQLQGDGAKPRE